MDLIYQIVIVLCFIYSIIAGMMPWIIKLFKMNKNVFNVSQSKSSSFINDLIIPIGNYFSGGMLLGYLFLKLLPKSYQKFHQFLVHLNSSHQYSEGIITPEGIITSEDGIITSKDGIITSENENQINLNDIHSNFPYVELIICGSFFVGYFIKQLTMVCSSQETIFIRESNKTESSSSSSQIPLNLSDDQSPAELVSLRKNDEIIINHNLSNLNHNSNHNFNHNHHASCPMNKKEVRLTPTQIKETENDFSQNQAPSSQTSSIIIVMPVCDYHKNIDLCTSLKRGCLTTLSYSIQQMINGFILFGDLDANGTFGRSNDNRLNVGLFADNSIDGRLSGDSHAGSLHDDGLLGDGNSLVGLFESQDFYGINFWVLLMVFLLVKTISIIILNKKLHAIYCRDPAIMFLCHLILSSGFPIGCLLGESLIRLETGQFLSSSISCGLLTYSIFLVLLHPISSSNQKFRILGYFLSVYSGFSLMLALILFIIP